MKPAVCLLSGGLDSTTCFALARREGYACYALSFDYGQRHRVELNAAANVASALGAVRHLIVPVNLRLFGGRRFLRAEQPILIGVELVEFGKGSQKFASAHVAVAVSIHAR